MSQFRSEPDGADILQIAGDAALDAIRLLAAQAGIEDRDLSVVISMQSPDGMATALHLPGEPEEKDFPQVAFEIQLLHTLASARAIGLDLRIVHIGQG